MEKAKTLIPIFQELEAKKPEIKDMDLSGALNLMIDELGDIDPKVLDRAGRLLIEEQPMYKVIIEHRFPKASPKDKGIGETLAVAIATSHLADVRNHLGPLLRKTAHLCVEAKAQGRRSFKGLTFEAVKSMPRPQPKDEAPAFPAP